MIIEQKREKDFLKQQEKEEDQYVIVDVDNAI